MLNPITYTEKIVGDFLRYQVTTYPFADPGLYAQLRELLSVQETRRSPLLKGPYISLSRPFRKGAALTDLAAEGILHPHIAQLAAHPHAYGHQEDAFRAIASRQSTIVSTGTGSGKTECFLYPIITRCLALRDSGAPAGISAVIVYPMNALAEDQLGRLRELLCGSGITFGMYTGSTPEKPEGVTGTRLPHGASRADYRTRVASQRQTRAVTAVHPPEERTSRAEMRKPGQMPRILLTNVKQLELLLTRQRDIELFDQALLDFLVFDEAHTFSGANGAETATLVRRLRAFCGRGTADTICVATSATIADPVGGTEAGRTFASRFFGVDASSVAVIGERFAEDAWAPARTSTPALPGDPALHLQTILEVVGGLEDNPADQHGLRRLKDVFQTMTGSSLDTRDWQQQLFNRLASNEVVFAIANSLRSPKDLEDLVASLGPELGRPISQEEVLCWLALGAASRRDGRALLRPVVHAFVRGVAGAVVTFPDDSQPLKLWLSASDMPEPADGDAVRDFALPVTTCTTCGQHYLVHHLDDFHLTTGAPGGGAAVDDRVVWKPLAESQGGRRAVLLDALNAQDDGSADDDSPRNTHPVHLCRKCGSVHPDAYALCAGCGAPDTLVRLWAVRTKEDRNGWMSTCVACGAQGRRVQGQFREPARPVRALTVSDVHVVAQSMIQHAEHRRLLVFADNRQDAAFQAGWMLDHARRYRFRALMYQRIRQSDVSAGDLTAWLEQQLDADDDLSRALIPEVWRVARKGGAGAMHASERRHFLRIQVLRELTTGNRQRIGLEPWARIRISYLGLDATLPFVREWAIRLGCPPADLCDGISALLDNARRSRMLHDSDTGMFSRYWHESDRDIQRGYFPLPNGGPVGLKLSREDGDHVGLVHQWVGARGTTAARHAVQRWGVPAGEAAGFLSGLWEMLCGDLALLAPVTLKGARDRPLPNCSGVRQVDIDRIMIGAHSGLHRCTTCRRPHVRRTPDGACLGYRCDGRTVPETEGQDNYDLLMLDQGLAMVRPREHSAQVPSADRDAIERDFKAPGERVNTLVCTPTLELGVDIGALDAVLMRNVPPLPSNYWQRAGRAGRRHQMSVNVTYARPASHDRAYFLDPLKLLQGRVEPPSFNLRNAVMVRKHVHACVLTWLFRLSRPESGIADASRTNVLMSLRACFPQNVNEYLFADGLVRTAPFETAQVRETLTMHRQGILGYVSAVFAQGWPDSDGPVVAPDVLGRHVDGFADELDQVIRRLASRLRWALDQLTRLEALRLAQGTLGPDDDSLRNRCDRLVKRLKGQRGRSAREAEGFDDMNTYSVLGAEGFLPGHGLDTGFVVATHQAPRDVTGLKDWELRRGLPMALREYAPGNLVYANGHRFVPRYFHLDSAGVTTFQVDVANEAVGEYAGGAGGAAGIGAPVLDAVPVCDVELPHHSSISDDEDYRFQMPVAVFGYEQGRHSGGTAHTWGPRTLLHRSGVHLRLVNVGPMSAVQGGVTGYPVCTVCGQSRSPFASAAELQHFEDDHRARCGKAPGRIGFHADVVADALRLGECANQAEAYSVMEALRQGAASVLEMEVDDLQLLSINHLGSGTTDMLMFDPMPGGSGLLEQLVERWPEVVASATELVAGCASRCTTACVDCLMRFRNAFYHRHLNRHVALDALTAWGERLAIGNAIPAMLPVPSTAHLTVTQGAQRLRNMLVRAGLTGFREEEAIQLGPPLGQTTPDFLFDDPTDRVDGVCIYLDGLSDHLHGNPATQLRDRTLRTELRNRMYEVIEIAQSDLTDRAKMATVLARLGRVLVGRDRGVALRNDLSWFDAVDDGGHGADAGETVEVRDTGSKQEDDGEADGPAGLPDVRAWAEALDLCDPAWRVRLTGLQSAGVRAPDEVGADLTRNARVIDVPAVAFWNTPAGRVGIVERPVPGDVDGTWLVVSDIPDPGAIAEALARNGVDPR